MPYAFINQGEAIAALAQRLYDSGQKFFSYNANVAHLKEALQTFNALANFYREEFVFTTFDGTAWYDVASQPGTLRPLDYTDTDILNLIEYDLLEPVSSTYPLVWTGSRQFNIQTLLSAIQECRDETLLQSGCTVYSGQLNAPVGAGRVFLDDSVIHLRRVVWIPVSGLGYTTNCLMSNDLWGQQSFQYGFPQADPATPLTYRRSTEPPVSFDVDIMPAIPGDYECLTVMAGPKLTDQSAALMPIPNDWNWVVRFGAMSQLFGRDSAASDPLRAQYCLMRYKMGIEAIKMAPAVLGARINDVPAVVDGVTNGDFYDANWQGNSGTPLNIYYAGLNLLGLSPVPDAGPYSVTVSVVRNMILPSTDTSYLQIGREDISAVLDLAQHLSMVKCGGAEFAATFPLFQNFMRHCMTYNQKLKALSPFLEMLDARSLRDLQENPILEDDGGSRTTNISG